MKKAIAHISPVTSISGNIRQGRRVQFMCSPGHRASIYVIKGKVCINQESAAGHDLVVFDQPGEEIIVTAEEDAQIVFFSEL